MELCKTYSSKIADWLFLISKFPYSAFLREFPDQLPFHNTLAFVCPDAHHLTAAINVKASKLPNPVMNIERKIDACSFEEAEQKGREENWAMAPEERIAICEHLRYTYYGDQVNTPIQRVFDADDPAPRPVYDHRRVRG